MRKRSEANKTAAPAPEAKVQKAAKEQTKQDNQQKAAPSRARRV